MNYVLVLEDDSSSLFVLKSILETNYRVILAETPEDAIRICRTAPPDLVVSDNLLKSPLSGVQTLCQIHEVHPAVPFLINSGTPPAGWGEADFDCLAKLITTARLDFLQKPFTVAELRAKAANLIGRTAVPGIQVEFAKAVAARAFAETRQVRFRPPSQEKGED